MEETLTELKKLARELQRDVRAGDSDACRRLKRLPELNKLADADVQASVRRRHCLSAIARELGFDGWQHASAVLRGQEMNNVGSLFYPGDSAAFWNIWCASYEEARTIRAEHGGFLLPFKHQYFICDRYFMENLGLQPDDPDWEQMGRDWVGTAAKDARVRQCHHVVGKRLREISRRRQPVSV